MAFTCDHCQFSTECVDSEANFCPDCGQPRDRDDEFRWSPIARFTELAEAGYFADELRSEGIRNRVVATSHLDVGGNWRSQFQLLVVEEVQDQAREWLSRHIAEHDDLAWNDDHEPARLPHAKRHVTGMLVIIGCSLSAGLLLGSQLRPPDPSFVEFWNAIKSSPTLATDPGTPGPARRLEFDEEQGIIRIRQDRDRDGVFDEQMEFRPAG